MLSLADEVATKNSYRARNWRRRRRCLILLAPAGADAFAGKICRKSNRSCLIGNKTGITVTIETPAGSHCEILNVENRIKTESESLSFFCRNGKSQDDISAFLPVLLRLRCFPAFRFLLPLARERLALVGLVGVISFFLHDVH